MKLRSFLGILMLSIFIKLFLNMLVVETFNTKEIVDKIVLYSEPVSFSMLIRKSNIFQGRLCFFFYKTLVCSI